MPRISFLYGIAIWMYWNEGVHAGRTFTRATAATPHRSTSSWRPTGKGLAATSRSSRSSPCRNIGAVEELVDIIGVEVIGDHRLRLTFEDGTVGDVDFRGRDWRGVFEPLRDPKVVARVTVDPEAGTIVWPGGLDMAPEPLYEAARDHPVHSGAVSR